MITSSASNTMGLFQLFVCFITIIIITTCQMSSCDDSLLNDVHCLESIKTSLEDPHGRLSSWDFTNKREGIICIFAGVSCWNGFEDKVLDLDLSNMGLVGNFPTGIRYCTSLTSLNLSKNALSGPIPAQIATLVPFITTLDLSYNNFSGHIPTNISKCPYLNILNLHHNRLSGNLPNELSLLSRIKVFHVSNNRLSGSVPDFENSLILKQSYANNLQLCGGPLEPCYRRNSFATFKLGFGVSYAFSFAFAFLYFSASSLQLKTVIKTIMRRISRRKQQIRTTYFPAPRHINEIPQLEKLVSKMSFRELSKATKDFSDVKVIGIGRTGTMYKATLPNGWFLAVKRFHETENSEAQFVSEILALSKMRHDNLIPLLGFCIENDERLLVYKYMANGNLFDCLHGVEARLVDWPLRVKIAVGTARGLAWLHHKCIFRVVHRNISSTSVLLDRFFEPKISNFGSCMISNDGGAMMVYENESESDSGLLVNNEEWKLKFVKKDVYDFGMVLTELITGKESNIPSNSLIFDEQLIGKGFEAEILRLMRIASDCVNPVAHQRPTMLKVYERLCDVAHKYGFPYDYQLLLQPRRVM